MYRFSIFFFLLLMFLTADVLAQKKCVDTVEWTIAGELPHAKEQEKALGLAGPVTGMHHQALIIAGGANFPDGMPWLGGKKKYHNDVYVFSERGKKQLAFYKHFKIPFTIAYAATCTTSEGVVAAGGENENGLLDKVFLLQWNKKKDSIDIKELPSLPFAVANATVTSIGSKVYLAGGETKTKVSNQFLVLDLKNTERGWQQLPTFSKPFSHAVMVAQTNGDDDCIYVMGGRKRNTGDTSTLYNSVWQYNSKTNQWSQKQPMPYALSAGTGAAVEANNIILFGGDRGETFHRTETLIAAIAAEKDESKKESLNREKINLQATHPGFSKEVLQYNTITDTWMSIGTIPFDVPVTTTAINCHKKIIIPSGEIRAGVRTPQILLGQYHCKK